MQALPGTGWASVSVSTGQFCAIKSDHTLYCQLGQIAGTTWAQVIVYGGRYEGTICALTTAGEESCWGYGEPYGSGSPYMLGGPVAIPGTWSSLAVDCALRADQTLWCGLNTADAAYLQQIAGASWTSVSVGGDITCATQSDHSLWCWEVVGMPTQIPGSWQAVSTTSTRHDCYLPGPPMPVGWCSDTCAISTDGSLSCWGLDQLGELGDTSSWKPTPTRLDF